MKGRGFGGEGLEFEGILECFFEVLEVGLKGVNELEEFGGGEVFLGGEGGEIEAQGEVGGEEVGVAVGDGGVGYHGGKVADCLGSVKDKCWCLLGKLVRGESGKEGWYAEARRCATRRAGGAGEDGAVE